MQQWFGSAVLGSVLENRNVSACVRSLRSLCLNSTLLSLSCLCLHAQTDTAQFKHLLSTQHRAVCREWICSHTLPSTVRCQGWKWSYSIESDKLWHWDHNATKQTLGLMACIVVLCVQSCVPNNTKPNQTKSPILKMSMVMSNLHLIWFFWLLTLQTVQLKYKKWCCG